MVSRIMSAALLAASATIAAQSLAPPQEPVALVNATVVNVADGSIQPNVSVVLRAGRIDSIAGPLPRDVKTLDLRGR